MNTSTERSPQGADVIPVTGATPLPRGKGMRTGYTTGACATASAAAATRALMTQHAVESEVVTLPAGQRVRFLMQTCTVREDEAQCSVFKDGGDDPDVTHGAEVSASVRWSGTPGIELRGGQGVGTVTRPGLGLEVGGPAINAVPRSMIVGHIARVVGTTMQDRGVVVTIAIPNGEALARKTLNGRLGIVGGLSILGTTGIVQPYSTAAWRASVMQSIDVAAENNLLEILLSTGGRSEKYGQQLLGLPEMALIEMGEFTGASLRHAVSRGIHTVHMCGMIGKYSKIAQGHFMTHVAGNQVDPHFIAEVAAAAGADSALVERMSTAHTARHAQELALEHEFFALFPAICARVLDRCRAYIDSALLLDIIMIDFEGNLLGRATDARLQQPDLRLAKKGAL